MNQGLRRITARSNLYRRAYAGLRGDRRAILRSTPRQGLRALAAAVSRNLASALIRANPASLAKYPG